MSETNRRKFRNVVFGAHKEIKLAVYSTMVPTLAMFILAWLLLHYFGGQVQQDFSAIVTPDQPPMIMLAELTARLSAFLLLGYGAIGAVGFFFCIKISQRLVGPITPITRHVKKLINGEYDEPLALRKDDLLTELRDNLNELTQQLKKQKTTNP